MCFSIRPFSRLAKPVILTPGRQLRLRIGGDGRGVEFRNGEECSFGHGKRRLVRAGNAVGERISAMKRFGLIEICVWLGAAGLAVPGALGQWNTPNPVVSFEKQADG